jgi:hypothetical protein
MVIMERLIFVQRTDVLKLSGSKPVEDSDFPSTLLDLTYVRRWPAALEAKPVRSA